MTQHGSDDLMKDAAQISRLEKAASGTRSVGNQT